MTATAVLCATLVAAAPIPKERADADKVVGVWKLVRSSNSPDGLTVGLTLELTAGGKLVIRQSSDGGPVAVYHGEYKVVKDELPYVVKYGDGVPDKKETLTIKKLSETELHVVDPDGIREEFERVKPAKKDGK